MSILHHFGDIIDFFRYLKRLRDRDHSPFRDTVIHRLGLAMINLHVHPLRI